MAAYVIFFREGQIEDKAAIAEYQRLYYENGGDPKPKILVVNGTTESVEGMAPEGIILLEFPSMADAKAWYNSPGYQAALPYRLKAAKYRGMIVEGL